MRRETTVLASLNAGLRAALAADARVIVLGEDLLDPYGGAFEVTRGLSTEFPDRVLATPISEAGIVAVTRTAVVDVLDGGLMAWLGERT